MKNIERWFFKYLINTQIYVSFCGMVLCSAVMLWNKQLDFGLLSFIFFSTLFAYNWAIYNFEKRESFREFLMIFGAFLALILAFFVIKTQRAFLGLSLLAIPTLLYNHRFFEIKFRTIPFLKIFLIALVWSVTACVLPWLNSNFEFSWSIVLQTIAMFLFVISIVIPFDIRDVNSDDEKLKTLPQFIGIKNSKIVAYIALFLSGVFVLISYPENIGILTSFFLTQIFTVFCINKSTPQKSSLFYSIWAESLCLLPSLFFTTLKITTAI